MALGLLSCIQHRHPSIPALQLAAPLKGALLISPWTSFSTDWQSHTANRDLDIHSGRTMKDWASDFASNDERNNHSEPALADVSWWTGMPVEKVLVVYGEYEIFRDDNKAFADTLGKAGIDVEQIECAKQVHIDCILDAQTGMQAGPMSEAIWKWLPTLY